jgi:hypothetical protein
VTFESWKRLFFSTYPPPTLIHLSFHFTTASKSAAYKSFDRCPSHFLTFVGIICGFRTILREFLGPILNRFTRQTLPTTNRKHFFMNILCIESFCPQKRTVCCSSVAIFTTWNLPLLMRLRICYLDCHEAGLCCYLVIHIGNLLRTLQLVYFHLWLYLLTLPRIRKESVAASF